MKEKLLKEGLKRRLLSIVLALAMVFSLLPMNSTVAKAEEITPTPLTFTALEAGSTVTFNWKSATSVEYSTDGESWNDYTAGTTLTLTDINDTVSFKGTNVVTERNNHFSMTGKISASGDVTSLKDGCGGDIALDYGCYQYMFDGCTSLTSAPALPSTTLASSCYGNMFKGCTSLTSAPALPATTLKNSCYSFMFYRCSSLTSAPILPATNLANSCYSNMFNGCTSLTSAPALNATTLTENCYNSMFYGCTGLTSAPILSATNLAASCYSNMFYGCTSLTSAPALPATTLKSSCYSYMFYGCTNLSIVPELKATNLDDFCYQGMFSSCTNLTVAETTNASEATWVFPVSEASEWNQYMLDYLTAPNTVTVVEGGKMYKVTHVGEHSFSNDTCQGVCIYCDEKNTSGNHDFSKLDNTKHKCSLCGLEVEHSFGDYQDKDGKHYQVCSDCGAETTHTGPTNPPAPGKKYSEVVPSAGAIKDITSSGEATAEINPYLASIINSSALETLVKVTAEEKAQGVNVWIKIVDASSTMSATDKAAIQGVAGDYTIGMYLDATLFKKVGTGTPTKVSDLNGKIKISLVIPENLRKEGRTFEIIRVHNGTPTVIQGTYDATTYTFTFETDQFSSYAIAYKDNGSNNGKNVTAPKTGDPYDSRVWYLLLIASLGGMLVIGGLRRKDKASK